MGIVEDVVDSKHLCHYGAKAEGVANGSQPRNKVAEEGYYSLLSGWNHREEDHKIKNDCSYSYEVV